MADGASRGRSDFIEGGGEAKFSERTTSVEYITTSTAIIIIIIIFFSGTLPGILFSISSRTSAGAKLTRKPISRRNPNKYDARASTSGAGRDGGE